MAERKKELELYVHLPFCVRKCNYCDFLSGPGYERDPYVEALLREMASYREKAEGFEVRSIFFGGGTPTLLREDHWEKLFAGLHENFRIRADAEITSEANPGTVDRPLLRRIKELGVNRLSMGLQSVRNEELALLGRIHTYEEFLRSWEMVRECGFSNVNLDLMGALPGQTVSDAMESVRKAAELSPEHISAYSLIIEEGTPFYERYAAGTGLPDEDTEREIAHETAKLLSSYGYEHYEISNYAKPGRQCLHNLGYWTGVPYLGFGMGAASLFGGERYANTRDYGRYVAEAGRGEIREEVVRQSTRDAMEEMMFLGLRLVRGVPEDAFAKRFGVPMEAVYGEVLEKYLSWGLLERAEGCVRLTERGMDVSNTVMADFILEDTDG